MNRLKTDYQCHLTLWLMYFVTIIVSILHTENSVLSFEHHFNFFFSPAESDEAESHHDQV